MKRGDVVIVALAGDFGKPRPALIIQSDKFAKMATLTVVPLTSTLSINPLLRIDIYPTSENGLRVMSQAMIDKVMTSRVDKVRATVGSLDDETMIKVTRALALFFGFA